MDKNYCNCMDQCNCECVLEEAGFDCPLDSSYEIKFPKKNRAVSRTRHGNKIKHENRQILIYDLCQRYFTKARFTKKQKKRLKKRAERRAKKRA